MQKTFVKQRALKGEGDRFMMSVPKDVGKAIRREAARAGLSLSAYTGLIVENYLEEQGILAEIRKEEE